MNTYGKELLKALGLKADAIKKIEETDDDKIKEFDAKADADSIHSAMKEVIKNEIGPEIKKEQAIATSKFIYDAVENFAMKQGGFKKEDLPAGSKWEDHLTHLLKVVKGKDGGAEGGDPKMKETITKLQEDLRKANEEKEEAVGKIPAIEQEWTGKLESFKSEIARENFIISTITKMDKKTIVPAEKVIVLIKDDLNSKYDIKQENGKFELYDKANPGARVQKTKTEFLTAQEAIAKEIEAQSLFALSNGQEEKKAVVIPGQEEKKAGGEEKKTTIAQSALDNEKELEDQLLGKK